jgi:hypothetical protein
MCAAEGRENRRESGWSSAASGPPSGGRFQRLASRGFPCSIVLGVLFALLTLSTARAQDEPNHSKLVYPGKDGDLVYEPDERDDCVPDFSNCGYRGGGVPLPDVPVRMTLEPTEQGDDAERIQHAIKTVSALKPDENGFRGAVLLKRGTYRVGKMLHIGTSGVVLRGEGQFEDGTVLVATTLRKYHVLYAAGSHHGVKIADTRQTIPANRVPVGTRIVPVASAKGFKVGDRVSVFRPATKEWLSDMGTDKVGWGPNSYSLHYERVITGIDGNTLTLDAPVVQAIQREYGGGSVGHYEHAGRIRNVGVEHIRFVSKFRHATDEGHGSRAIIFDHIEDSWIRNVTAVHFAYATAELRWNAKHITVQDSACLDPVSRIKGGRRYSFNLCGQLCLFQRCYARHGRHDFVMHARGRGPNVFLDCRADKAHSDSGPHHRWSVATLYDNVQINGHGLTALYAGTRGTGHGWTGGRIVCWNCKAGFLICQAPPTSMNYMIGCIGPRHGGQYRRRDGHWESHGRHVEPRSLYLAQLRDRLGQKAVEAVTTPEQRKGPIHAELRKRLGR